MTESREKLEKWSRKQFGGKKKSLEVLLQQLRDYKWNHQQYEKDEEIKRLEKRIDNIL